MLAIPPTVSICLLFMTDYHLSNAHYAGATSIFHKRLAATVIGNILKFLEIGFCLMWSMIL
ncbi:hypothetical protein SPH9361_04706 [Sphingobium sp. CECT 9361]|nr:hypothetical protein SPH9361_04706 [Sphingobium sp. CECT 9361]